MRIHDTLLLASGATQTRRGLREIFAEGFNLLEAANRAQTLFLLEQNHSCIASVLLDSTIPEKLDLTFLEELNSRGWLKRIPVIVLTPPEKPDAVAEAFRLGAVEAMRGDTDPFVVQQRVLNIVQLYRNQWHLEKMVEDQSAILRHSNDAVVEALSSIIEYRSVETGQHILRIRRFTHLLLEEIARSSPRYRLTEETIRIIAGASALHDIGKISVPDAVLNKPGPLTTGEWEIMKRHCVTGSRIIELLADVVDHEYLRYAYNISRYHHERWDGNGYPEGLTGDRIPICAQVVGLADAYDALTTSRVYRDAVDCDRAANMIIRGECGTFSRPLLECFKRVADQFAEVAGAYADGFSPKAEQFATQLPQPSRQEEPSALQILGNKYQMLLHYLDTTVVEVDLDQNVYHVVYNPDPDLSMLSAGTSLEELAGVVESQAKLPEERQQIRSFSKEHIPRFLREGLMRLQHRLPIYSRITGRREQYDITVLRQSLADRDQHKLIVIWQKVRQTAPQTGGNGAEDVSERIPESLLPVHCSFRNDRYLTLEHIDERAYSFLGYTREEFERITRSGLINLLHPDDRKEFMKKISGQLAQGRRLELECRLLCADGSIRWILNRCRLEAREDGSEVFSGFILNITKTKQGQDELCRQLELQQIILSQTENILYEWDMLSDKLTFSRNWEKIFGRPSIDGMLADIMDSGSWFHPEDISVVRESIAAMESGSDYQMIEVRIVIADGRYLWCRFRSSAQRDEAGNLVKLVGVVINIDAEKRSAQALQERAERDMLTKLLNKSAAREQAEDYLADSSHNTTCALFIIDLDNFKQINDHFGHLFGDAVLTQVATEIRRMFRSQDIIARIGGDEFMVLMRGVVNAQVARSRCAQLVEAFRNVLRDHLQGKRLSCSVGVSLFPEHGTSYVELFQRADQALYQAKAKGKDGFAVFDSKDPYYFSRSYVSAAVTQIDSDDRSSLSQGDIIRYAFRTLYRSGDVEATIQEILSLTGQVTDVSRVYIFENSPDNRFCSNTFEWCNTGIASQKAKLQNVSYHTDIPNLQASFDEREIFYCPDITQLSPDLYRILAPQKIKSILLCAIRDRGVFRGYMGFDECMVNRYWTREQIDVLSMLAELVSVFLLKWRMEEEIRHLQQLQGSRAGQETE